MKPIFEKPKINNMDFIGVRLEQLGLKPIDSMAIKNATYVRNGNDICLYTGNRGLLRFKLENMEALGQELIEISNKWRLGIG